VFMDQQIRLKLPLRVLDCGVCVLCLQVKGHPLCFVFEVGMCVSVCLQVSNQPNPPPGSINVQVLEC